MKTAKKSGESSEPATDDAPKRKGRPPKPPMPYEGPHFGLSDAEVTEVQLADIDLEDAEFQCRVTVNHQPLVESIKHHGIQTPLVVRKHPRKKDKLQIVCGFQRAAAAREIGLVRVPVLERRLGDDEAHILAFADNQYRRTLNDLDRATGIAKLVRQGKTQDEVAQLYRLSERQVRRLQDLLTYPQTLQKAISADDGGMTATHATIIMQASRKRGRGFDVDRWVKYVRKEKPGVDGLRSAIAEESPRNSSPRKPFARTGDRVALNIKAFGKATEASRAKVISQVETLLKELKTIQKHTGH